jgi:hypothetical protein
VTLALKFSKTPELFSFFIPNITWVADQLLESLVEGL